jgi:hypothetical protein
VWSARDRRPTVLTTSVGEGGSGPHPGGGDRPEPAPGRAVAEDRGQDRIPAVHLDRTALTAEDQAWIDAHLQLANAARTRRQSARRRCRRNCCGRTRWGSVVGIVAAGGRARRTRHARPPRHALLRQLITAGRPYHVSVPSVARPVDSEVEPGDAQGEVPVRTTGHHAGVRIPLPVIGPETDRAGRAPGPIATARAPVGRWLDHAGKFVTPP